LTPAQSLSNAANLWHSNQPEKRMVTPIYLYDIIIQELSTKTKRSHHGNYTTKTTLFGWKEIENIGDLERLRQGKRIFA